MDKRIRVRLVTTVHGEAWLKVLESHWDTYLPEMSENEDMGTEGLRAIEGIEERTDENGGKRR